MDASELIAQGYYQVSRNHRVLARFPQGRSGKAALRAVVSPAVFRQVFEAMPEGECGDHYLAAYAPPEDRVTVDLTTFRAFRALGGDRYSKGARG